jgi:NAD(P)-dependent dehydrogenase (short-subunit alcohol dehydrogenase family)
MVGSYPFRLEPHTQSGPLSGDSIKVIDLIKAEGRVGLALPGDLRDEAFCQKLVDDAVKGMGGLDIVVSNAGRQQTHESILDITTEQFDWTMKTNIYAPFWIIKAALPHLKPGSAIIGTTSEQATDPSPDLYDYAQTKAATTNYVRSLSKQLASKGIRVNGVAPGPIWTPLQVSGGATQEKLKKFGGQTPLGRPGQPVELASIYVQLAANDASYTTGPPAVPACLEVGAQRFCSTRTSSRFSRPGKVSLGTHSSKRVK